MRRIPAVTLLASLALAFPLTACGGDDGGSDGGTGGSDRAGDSGGDLSDLCGLLPAEDVSEAAGQELEGVGSSNSCTYSMTGSSLSISVNVIPNAGTEEAYEGVRQGVDISVPDGDTEEPDLADAAYLAWGEVDVFAGGTGASGVVDLGDDVLTVNVIGDLSAEEAHDLALFVMTEVVDRA